MRSAIVNMRKYSIAQILSHVQRNHH